MTSMTRRSLIPLYAALAALVAPAAASADAVVAELTRDTPIAAYGGVVAWSGYDAASGRYRLIVRRGDQAAPAPIAGSRRAFDVSLGPDARGRVVALYTRCRTANHGCDVYRYDVQARREHKVLGVSSPTKDEAWPVQWRGRLAFVRRAWAYVPDAVGAPGVPGKPGRGERVRCDVPYVRTLSARAPSRRLDRGLCAETTGMSIRGDSIVQVTNFYVDFNAAETQVRRLRARGGAARVLARAPGGLGGYSPFSSPSQSASAVWLTRTGFREGVPTGFLRIDLTSGRLTAINPNVPLAGRVARDERGVFWYVQGPEPGWDYHGEPPFCTSELQPCRLLRASASPFVAATRTLMPQVRISVAGSGQISVRPGEPLVLSGDISRPIVRGNTVVGREPLPQVSLELMRNDSEDGEGPFTATGLTATTDQAGRWTFSLSQPPASAFFAAAAPAIRIASQTVVVTATAGSR
jgi:hypothetical protein